MCGPSLKVPFCDPAAASGWAVRLMDAPKERTMWSSSYEGDPRCVGIAERRSRLLLPGRSASR